MVSNRLYCLWAPFIVSTPHIQGTVPKTYFPTSWLSDRSEWIDNLLGNASIRVHICKTMFGGHDQHLYPSMHCPGVVTINLLHV